MFEIVEVVKLSLGKDGPATLRCLKTIVDDLRDGEQGVEEGCGRNKMDSKEACL